MKAKEAELVASCEKASPPYSGRYTRAAAHPPSPVPSVLYQMTPRKIQKAVHLGGEFLRQPTHRELRLPYRGAVYANNLVT
jgi:hypothetical protein